MTYTNTWKFGLIRDNNGGRVIHKVEEFDRYLSVGDVRRTITEMYGFDVTYCDLVETANDKWGRDQRNNNTNNSYSGGGSDDWFWALLGGSLSCGIVASYKLTKWAAPKIWKGCELAVQGTEWVLANTR